MAGIKGNYSSVVIDYGQNPRNRGGMPDADGYARITGPCGDTMEISIMIKDQKIVRCTFDTDGCGASIACGSMITVLATGKTLLQARRIRRKDILAFCKGLPEEDRHCALLAANTLQKALDDYGITRNDPWKKLYR